jgi:F-type H+-transporting ATPase subunit delta
VLSVASSPKVTRKQVAELLLSVKSPLAAGAEANFVQMLVDNRIALLPEIAEQFEALKNEREGAPTRDRQRVPAGRRAARQSRLGLERKFGAS